VALADAPILGIEVGLRPGRPDGVRLQAEQVGPTTVVHNYGHDGSGVFWSWGCAAALSPSAAFVHDPSRDRSLARIQVQAPLSDPAA
jgi:glycine/D-amino acid oxidase-like deaminating enzyme